jgi:hypothetical protein
MFGLVYVTKIVMCYSLLVRRIIVSFNYEKMMHVINFYIRSVMVSKHSKLTNRQV